MNDRRVAPPTLTRKVLAWGVHIYTGSGLLLAVWITLLLVRPERTAETYRLCFFLMLVATFIDATDGFLARWLRVKEVLPQFDGRRLDDLVDFVMYTCLPLAMVHRMELLPEGFGWVLIVALGASAYGFSQSDVKTANGAFQGFPSYWNIVAFYLYTLPLTSEIAVAIILVFSFLTFVPSYYPYPTQPGTVNRVMLLLSIPWTILVLVALLMSWEESVPHVLARTSVAYPLLYLGVAWGMSLWRIRKAQ